MPKKRQKHGESIIQTKEDWRRCYLCMRIEDDYSEKPYLQTHHIFGGAARRKISEAEGFTVRLCIKHHAHGGLMDVHQNAEFARILHEDAQRAYEKQHSRKEFIELMHKNYLEEEGKKQIEKGGIKWLNVKEELPW